MINKKRFLLFFVSLIVICLTVSVVSAAEDNSDALTDAQSIDTTEVQKVVNNTQTIETAKKNNEIQKTVTNKDVKTNTSTGSTYYVATNGKSSNSGTESSPFDLVSAVNKVKQERGGNINVAGGTYKLTSTLTFNLAGTYSITGKSGQTITFDGQSKDRIIYVGGNANLNVNNIIFTNGKNSGVGGAIFEDYNGKLTVNGCTFNSNTGHTGAAIYARGSSLTVQNSKFNQNKATNSAGGIFTNVANSVISKNTFSSNNGGETGGAIQVSGSNVKVTDNTFTSNSAKNAGAIAEKDSTGTTIQNNIFTKNIATSGGGGAIYMNNAKKSTISNNNFKENGNQGTLAGGAIVINPGSDITISNNNFTSNKAVDTSGAIFTSGSNVAISNNKFTQNTATRTGGAIFDEGSGLKVLNNEFTKNSITNDGGALYVRGPNAVVQNNKFDSNTANRSCGALYINNNSATVKLNTFTNNVAKNVAGALYNENAKNTIISDNIFTKNKASSNGGAIVNNNANTATITKNQFDTNTASGNGGAIASEASTKVTISNNIFTSNSGNNGGAISTGGSCTGEIIKANDFTKNKATNNGGAIYNNAPGCTITENNFTSNVATKNLGGAITNYGKNTQITKNNFIANSANYNGDAIRDNAQATKSNNKNADTSKCSATIYNGGSGSTISNNVFEDSLPVQKVDTTVTVSNSNGVLLDPMTFTATVKDVTGKNVNGGNLVFKLNKNTIKNSAGEVIKVQVKNGVAKLTATAIKSFNNANITASYSGSSAYNPSSSKNKAVSTVSRRSAKATVSLSAAKVKQYESVTITVKLTDVTPNTKITTPSNNDKSYVVLKINGKTIKNSKNEAIKFKVTNGVATFKYSIPKGMAGYYNNSPRYYTITACYSHPDYILTGCDSAKFTVEKSNVTFETTKVVANMTSKKLVIQGNIKDYKGNNVVGINKLSVKINGKTLTIDGSNVKSINNGVINLVIDIPSAVRDVKEIMLVTGERDAYNGCRTTLTNFIKV